MIKRKFSDFYKSSKVFNYNVLDRNEWVQLQSKSIKNNSHVLDAGAGSCTYKKYFSHCEYKAQDFESLSGDQLSGGKYGSIDYVCDIAQIPVSDSEFDVVLCTEVLEHVPEPIVVIKEFSRILKSGGKLLLTAPLGSGIHQEPYHFYGGYTPYWYKKFLSESGFINIIVEENSGSIRASAQESVRFIILTYPFSLDMPILAKLFWLPIWLMLLPFMGLIAPFASYWLNKHDKNKRFTIGYHVTAEKAKGIL